MGWWSWSWTSWRGRWRWRGWRRRWNGSWLDDERYSAAGGSQSLPEFVIDVVVVCAYIGCRKTTDKARFGRQRQVDALVALLHAAELLKPSHSSVLCNEHWERLRRSARQ